MGSNGSRAIEPQGYRLRPRYLGLSTRVTLILVVVLGLFAALQAPEATRNYGGTFSHTGPTVVVLFLVSLTNVAVTRFLMLPAIARRGMASLDSVIVMGYTFAVTPIIYGLIAVVLSGQGSVSLPFSLLSLLAVVDLRLYFAHIDEQARS